MYTFIAQTLDFCEVRLCQYLFFLPCYWLFFFDSSFYCLLSLSTFFINTKSPLCLRSPDLKVIPQSLVTYQNMKIFQVHTKRKKSVKGHSRSLQYQASANSFRPALLVNDYKSTQLIKQYLLNCQWYIPVYDVLLM